MKRWAGAAGVLLLVAGALLARAIEPGVTISRVELSLGPAVRVAPIGSAVRPTALLAHGVTASKETLVRLAEALALSGFECLVVDFPGHGESRGSLRSDAPGVLEEGARALSGTNRVDVVAGHSMGAYVAAHAIDTHRIEARLLLAFGAVPRSRVETVYLEGAWEELLVPPAGAVVSPWSDHCLEPWDPVLVGAAVSAACVKAGLTPVPASRWKLRALGAMLALAGVLLLIFGLTPSRGGALTGLGVATIALAWPAFGLPLWFAGMPTRTHWPLQLGLALLTTLGSLVVQRVARRRARVTQGAFAGLGLLLATGAFMAGNSFGALAATILTGVTALGWALGAFAEARTTSADAGHAAFGLWLGYLLGQWCPLPF